MDQITQPRELHWSVQGRPGRSIPLPSPCPAGPVTWADGQQRKHCREKDEITWRQVCMATAAHQPLPTGQAANPHPTVGTGGPPAPWEGQCRAGRSWHRAVGGHLGSSVNMNCPDVPCGGQGSPVPATPGPRGPGEPCRGWEEMSSEAGLRRNRPGLARGMEAFSESTVTTKLQTQPGG